MSTSSTPVRPARATIVPRPRRPHPEEMVPLGSLTQREHRPADGCAACGSPRLTRLTMSLSDGVVDFVSCHHCEHRRWEEAGTVVAVNDVLSRTARR